MRKNEPGLMSVPEFTGSLLVISVVSTFLSLNRLGPKPSTFGIHQYLLDWVQAGHNLNLQGQREAHVFGLVVLAALIVIGTLFGIGVLKFNQVAILRSMTLIFLLGFCVAACIYWFGKPIDKATWLALCAAFTTICVSLKPISLRNNLSNLLFAVLASIGLAATLPGLLAPYDASWMAQEAMVEFQEGYSVVVAQGDQIAQGKKIFEDVKPHYGVLLPILCGLYERTFGLLSFGQHVQLVRFLQLLSVATIFLVYAWYSRKRIIPLMVAFLFVLPWLHTNQISILFPNLSSWRNLSFAVAALGLMLAERAPCKWRALPLGGLCGLCFALNQEIGVAIFFGLLSYLYFSHHSPGILFPQKFFAEAISYSLGICVVAVALYCLFSVFLGYSPNLHAYLEHLKYVQMVARSGYSGGFAIEFNPVATCIFFHYCYVLLSAALTSSAKTRRICFRAFAATTGLVWFAYYFNRPHEWYLQPQFFLYGFLLIDLVRSALQRSSKDTFPQNKVAAILIVCCCVIPQTLFAFADAWPPYRRMISVLYGQPSEANAQFVDGIFVSTAAAQELRAKAAMLADTAKKNSVVFLTGSTMLIPKLSKYCSPVAYADPYQELLTDELTQRFIDSVKNSSVTTVLVDSDNCYLKGDKSRLKCWKLLEQGLRPEFVFTSETAGWRVLSRHQNVEPAK